MLILRRLLAFEKPYFGAVAVALLGMFLVTGMDLTIPQIVRVAIDRALVPGQLLLLGRLCLLVVGLGVLRSLALFAQAYLSEAAAQRAAYDLRSKFFDHLQRLPFSFYDSAQTGELMTRATGDVEVVRRFLSNGPTTVGRNLSIFIGVLVLCFWMNWRLAFLALASFPILVVSTLQFRARVRPIATTMREQVAHMTAFLQEVISGVRVVKAFAREEEEIERFSIEADLAMQKSYAFDRLWSFYDPYMGFLAALGTTAVLWFGGHEVIRGSLSLGGLVAFNSYLLMLVGPVRMLGFVVSITARAMSSGELLFSVLDQPAESRSVTSGLRDAEPVPTRSGQGNGEAPPNAAAGRQHPAIHSPPSALPAQSASGHVRFQHVAFSYDGVTPVLRDISFDARPGETLAILGATGSGKTSIINLLPRFYDPTEGRILIDGRDTRRMSLAELRRDIGMVLQETYLFSATLRENIAYGRPDAPMDEVIEAARKANIHDFVTTLPQGYETRVGERGVTLSGGQKQRVAIARALLADPRILILDDSTSSVDTETEHQIQSALHLLMKDRTSLVIAQRFSTVKDADHILVLDDGRVAEAGTHTQLLELGGLYARLCRIQLRGAQDVPAWTEEGESHVGASAR